MKENNCSVEILFCNSTEYRKAPTFEFEREFEAATDVGFDCRLFGFEDFLEGRESRALELIPKASDKTILYRGWMFSKDEHRRFSSLLRERGYQLLTSTEAYSETLYLPNYHPLIKEIAPRSVWTFNKDLNEAWNVAQTLGPGPWIVKDHVKSAKHRWESSCFIPENVDRSTFDEICLNLVKYQGNRFARGFVFKQFVPLRSLGENLYEYPASEEYRLIYFRRQLLAASPYLRKGGSESDFTCFLDYAQRFRSEFLTLDVAKTEDDRWLIIDVGDGGVSSLPPALTPEDFYRRLRDRLMATDSL